MAAARDVGPQGVFRKTGGSLTDFVENVVPGEHSADVIAAKALDYFCRDEGKFNRFMPGVALAVAFLDSMMDGPTSEQRAQCLKDLKSVLDGGGSLAQLLQWVRSYYT